MSSSGPRSSSRAPTPTTTSTSTSARAEQRRWSRPRPAAGNGPYAAEFAGATGDGTHVFFRNAGAACRRRHGRRMGPLRALGRLDHADLDGPSGGNGNYPAEFAGTSDNGAHVFFRTRESMTAGDSDNCSGKGCYDIYERSGGTTSLVSTGPSGGNASAGRRHFAGVSEDGTRVFFTTKESLVSADADGQDGHLRALGRHDDARLDRPGDQHAYEACTRPPVSAAPAVGDLGGRHAGLLLHARALVPGDTGYLDLYERSCGTTKLVSTGPDRRNGPYHVDRDPSSRSRRTARMPSSRPTEKLDGHDTDSYRDIYERSGGTTTLVSIGPSGGNGSFAALRSRAVSEDGSRVFFETAEQARSGRHRQPDRHLRALQRRDHADLDRADGRRHARPASSWPRRPTGRTSSSRRGMPWSPATPTTARSLVTGCYDFYDASIAYETPASASPLQRLARAGLPPVRHGRQPGRRPALAAARHSPPACRPSRARTWPTSAPRRSARASSTVVPGNPDTTADEADVSIQANLTDIGATGGGDYNPSPTRPRPDADRPPSDHRPRQLLGVGLRGALRANAPPPPPTSTSRSRSTARAPPTPASVRPAP